MDTNDDLQRTLGRIEGALTALTTAIRENQTAQKQHNADIETRVTKLEGWRIYTTAFAIGACTVVTILGGILWRVLSLLPK